jgi:hypothetical protein
MSSDLLKWYGSKEGKKFLTQTKGSDTVKTTIIQSSRSAYRGLSNSAMRIAMCTLLTVSHTRIHF